MNPNAIAEAVASQPSKRSVFILEDHPVFREGLVQMLNGEEDLAVCGTAGDAEQAERAISRLNPDLVVVDISLPGKSGLALIKALRAAGQPARILVISMHDEALYANRVLRAGGDGYIMKREDPDEVVHAIRDVLAGRIYVSEQVLNGRKEPEKAPAKAEPHLLETLDDAELELLEILGLGKSDREIARQLGLKPKSVGARLAKVRKKLKLPSTNALIRYAVCWVETNRT